MIKYVEGGKNMALEWVWCPICHEGEGCFFDENKGVYVCPTTGYTFTAKESCDDINK